MLNDPLANVLAKIMNAEKVGIKRITIKPSSKLIKEVLKIMHEENYIGSFKETEDKRGNALTINLLGSINKCNVIKPRYPIKNDGYEKYEKRYLPAKDFGILIVSTNKGTMKHTKAKEKNLGGRLLAFVY